MSNTTTVRPGEGFWQIAERVFGDGSRYKEIIQFNGLSENHPLHAGDRLRIPDSKINSSRSSGDRPRISGSSINSSRSSGASAYGSSSSSSRSSELVSRSQFNKALRDFPEQSQKYSHFVNSLHNAGITTIEEAAMYLAQLIHESDGLRTTREYPNPLSEDLYGRYIGRGYIQLSSKGNYEAAGNALNCDYVSNPEIVEHDPHAWNVSAWYWITQVHCHASNGFKSTTTEGIRPATPHHNRRKRFMKMCAELLVVSRIIDSK